MQKDFEDARRRARGIVQQAERNRQQAERSLRRTEPEAGEEEPAPAKTPAEERGS